MGYEETLRLPMRSFWFMNVTIDRVNAQKDMRSIGVSVCSMGGEIVSHTRDRLVLEVGTVVKVKENPSNVITHAKMDLVGFAELAIMAKERIGS